jgi:ElaB/YqjD/DUF883 family membrane-anchored ribosome-binding protein
MNYEEKNEAQRHNGGDETQFSRRDSTWGEKLKGFVEGVKENPRSALHNIGEAAGQAKDYVNETAGQAREYVEKTSFQDMLSDAAGLIKRCPFAAMAVGLTLGFLVSRRRA